jgi:hypothetical protein
MPELSNIQTFEKLIGNDYQPTLNKFIKVLKRINLWNDEIKKEFDEFEWKIEDNGFVYSSITQVNHYKTNLSDIPIRPLVMVYTPAIDKTFKDNWMICEFLIEAEKLRNFHNGQFYDTTYELIKKLSNELFIDFRQTGVYFTDEVQDCQDFDAIRCNDSHKLWQFDYALIPITLEKLYSKPPQTHKLLRFENYFESWDIERWKK